MKLTKFGILVNKTYFFVHFNITDSKISRGCAKILEIPEGRGGGKFWGSILENPEGRGGSYGKSLPGGYGYFLETHISSLWMPLGNFCLFFVFGCGNVF